jgi:hypothetical protein
LQSGCARQRLLAIGGHEGLPGAAADSGISPTPAVLIDDARTAPGIAPGPPGHRLHQNLGLTRRGALQQAKAKETAELGHAWIALAAAAPPRGAYRKPDLVAGG